MIKIFISCGRHAHGENFLRLGLKILFEEPAKGSIALKIPFANLASKNSPNLDGNTACLRCYRASKARR